MRGRGEREMGWEWERERIKEWERRRTKRAIGYIVHVCTKLYM